jgi:hypothetical protein
MGKIMSVYNSYADGYASFANYAYNILNKTLFFQDIFSKAQQMVKDPNFLSQDFLNHFSDFPKFPNFFNVISGQNYIKLNDIFNVASDQINYLPEAISNHNVLRYKLSFDKIPNDVNELVKQAYIQYGYLTTLLDIYDFDLFLRPLSSQDRYRNYVDYLYSDRFESIGKNESAGFENCSLFSNFILQDCFNTFFNFSFNLYSCISQYVDIMNNVDGDNGKELVKQDFRNLISNNKSEIATDLTELILKTMYGVSNATTNLKLQIKNVIETYLTDTLLPIGDSPFDLFISEDYVSSPDLSIMNNMVQCLFGICSCDFNGRTGGNSNYVNLDKLTTWSFNEYNSFLSYTNKLNVSDIQPYLFLIYCYKFWPQKFLNIASLSIRKYVEDYIKTYDESNTSASNQFDSDFDLFFNSFVNYTQLTEFAAEVFSNIPTIKENITTPVVFTHTNPDNFIVLASAIKMDNGTKIKFATTNTLPSDIITGSGLSTSIYYYVRLEDVAYTQYSLYDSKEHAISGGSTGQIPLSSMNSGIGTHTVVFDEIVLSFPRFTHAADDTIYIELETPLIMNDGTAVELTTTGELPHGISLGVVYYVKNEGEDSLKYSFYDTRENAISGGVVGRVSMFGTGIGIHSVMSNYFWATSQYYQVPEFAVKLYGIYIIDEFLKPSILPNKDFYRTFANGLLEAVFDYLYSQAMVSYDFAWYNNYQLVDIYLKIYLRNKLFINQPNDDNEFLTLLTKEFVSEVKTVATNRTGISSLDVSVNATKLTSCFTDIVNHKSKQIPFQFYNNMQLSLLSREIIYGVMSNFIA